MTALIHARRVAVFRNDVLALSETFIRAQVAGAQNWQVLLVGQRRVTHGLCLESVNVRLIPPATKLLSRLLEHLKFWLNQPIPRIEKALKALEVQLVHVHFGIDATEIWPSVKAAGLPMLVTLHGYDINIHREWWEAGYGGTRKRAYPSRLLKMAQEESVRFVAVSNAIKQRAIEYGIPEDKITVAYIGVDTQQFKPGGEPLHQRRKRILFVGRMVEKKAPLLMIRAFSELREDLPDIELVMIGDGPLLEEAKRLADELGAPASFLGARSSAEVLAQIHEARVLCLPSVTAANGDAEGFGLVILEAQACGIPVVTSALGGADEGLINGVTGSAFRSGSIGELKIELRRWLEGNLEESHVSAIAPNFIAEKFDMRSCIAHLEEIYDELSMDACRS